jgi:hypothetical protein
MTPMTPRFRTPRFSSRVPFGVAALLAWMLPAAASAQSLAEVARAEGARRGRLAKQAKVYTNQDLTRDPTAPTSVPAPTGSSPGQPGAGGPGGSSAPADNGAGQASSDAVPAEPEPARTESYWRERMTTARAAQQRAQMFASALQSQINALTTDFVNRDDPAQRTSIEQNRLKAMAELERVQRDVAASTTALRDIEDEARKAGVPAGWLR